MEEIEYLERIGKNIKDLRMSKGVSQVELAYRCNFEKTNLCRIESGNNNPTVKTLFKISKALKVSVQDLLKV